jgi:hypothetical protein
MRLLGVVPRTCDLQRVTLPEHVKNWGSIMKIKFRRVLLSSRSFLPVKWITLHNISLLSAQ